MTGTYKTVLNIHVKQMKVQRWIYSTALNLHISKAANLGLWQLIVINILIFNIVSYENSLILCFTEAKDLSYQRGEATSNYTIHTCGNASFSWPNDLYADLKSWPHCDTQWASSIAIRSRPTSWSRSFRWFTPPLEAYSGVMYSTLYLPLKQS